MHATKILMNPEELIAHFALAPHPEGGFYRRTYCSSGTIPQAALSSVVLIILPLSTLSAPTRPLMGAVTVQ